METLRWTVIRIASGLATIVGIAIAVFLAARIVPGNASTVLLGPLASEERRAELTAELGLDDGLATQLWRWLSRLVHGDFGTSLVNNEPVIDEIAARLPVTATIALMALLIGLLIGVPVGIWQAVHARRAGSTATRMVSTLGISVPEFVVGALVVLLFSTHSLGITIGDFTSITDDISAGLKSALLPAGVLAIFCAAATARTTRDAVLDVLVEPYIHAAVARGEHPRSIVVHHVLRNAAIPVLTLTATLLGYLLGGAVIIEALFNVPGVGAYLLRAMSRRDYAVIQVGVLLAAVVFVVMSMLVELCSNLIDPRVSTMRGRR